MTKIVSNIIEKYHLNPRIVFLIDGLGASFSAILLVLLLANYESIFGLPKKTIYLLSIPAFVLMVYSLSCYFLNLKKWKPYLKAVAVANSLYCILTLCSIIRHHETLTIIGLIYFIGEIAIISFLISIEWIMIKNGRN